MPLKSTQTNKYETACFVQEAPVDCGLESYKTNPRGFKQFTSVNGHAYVEFDSTVQTFGCYNRMKRRYDPINYCGVVDVDERISELKRKNDWRGELNHPNPDIRGQQLTDIRMTIPEPTRCSHMIRHNRREANILRHIASKLLHRVGAIEPDVLQGVVTQLQGLTALGAGYVLKKKHEK